MAVRWNSFFFSGRKISRHFFEKKISAKFFIREFSFAARLAPGSLSGFGRRSGGLRGKLGGALPAVATEERGSERAEIRTICTVHAALTFARCNHSQSFLIRQGAKLY
jgi:hypothetical protein